MTATLYDALDRPVTVVHTGEFTRMAFVNNITYTRDAAGKWRSETRDALGRLTSVTEDPVVPA